MKQTLLLNKLGLEILTDTGWESFDGIINKGVKHTITVETSDAMVMLTPDHNIYINNTEKKSADQLKVGDQIATLSGPALILSIKENALATVYDIVNAGPNYRFYANDILCANCEFIIADETLINPNTLFDLEGTEPLIRTGQIRWYGKPEKGNIYCVGLDPSLGTGSDPAAIQIYEANSTRQIGEWKHNRTDIPRQIKLLADINRYIAECTGEPDNIYYSIENNSIGEAALVSLNEFGESNIPGIFLSEPGKKRKGFNTTQKAKLAACAKFKTLLESKKMTIKSKSLVSELKTFVASGGSYAAKIGDHDDLVMGSLLVVRMLQVLSDFHHDLEEQIRDHDELIMPLPFFAVI